MAYIIDTYNRWDKWDQEHSKYVFCINKQWYAVKEVKLEWGLPQLPMRVQDREPYLDMYHIYETYEDAMAFVFLIKSLN